jgi:hypothetical protein
MWLSVRLAFKRLAIVRRRALRSAILLGVIVRSSKARRSPRRAFRSLGCLTCLHLGRARVAALPTTATAATARLIIRRLRGR